MLPPIWTFSCPNLFCHNPKAQEKSSGYDEQYIEQGDKPGAQSRLELGGTADLMVKVHNDQQNGSQITKNMNGEQPGGMQSGIPFSQEKKRIISRM